MKIPTASSATSFQRVQISLRSLMPRLPRSNVYSTRDPENPSASVHRKRSLTPSLALKFLCTGELNPRNLMGGLTVRLTAGPSDQTNSPHPSSREGHHSTARWSSGILLSQLILHGPHAAAAGAGTAVGLRPPSAPAR